MSHIFSTALTPHNDPVFPIQKEKAISVLEDKRGSTRPTSSSSPSNSCFDLWKTAGVPRKALGLCCTSLGSPLFHSPNAWLCYKPAANVPELEQRRCSNKCLLNWVILLCLDWARILLTDPLGFTITSTQWFSIRASNPSPRATGHYLETRLVIPGLGWEGVVWATGIWGV